MSRANTPPADAAEFPPTRLVQNDKGAWPPLSAAGPQGWAALASFPGGDTDAVPQPRRVSGLEPTAPAPFSIRKALGLTSAGAWAACAICPSGSFKPDLAAAERLRPSLPSPKARPPALWSLVQRKPHGKLCRSRSHALTPPEMPTSRPRPITANRAPARRLAPESSASSARSARGSEPSPKTPAARTPSAVPSAPLSDEPSERDAARPAPVSPLAAPGAPFSTGRLALSPFTGYAVADAVQGHDADPDP